MNAQLPEGLQFWTPYCGVAPSPADLAGRWNADPVLLAGLASACVAFALHRRLGGQGRAGLFALAVGVLALAFVSPLCALSSALFSARVVHHALLVAVAAPLVAFSLPRAKRGKYGLAWPVVLHAITLWAWHAPAPYAWALSTDVAYWTMQATLFGSALVVWLRVRQVAGLPAAGALLFTFVQTGLLGALITFAERPLYAPHFDTTLAFGLTPLADQQLAGLIMWAPMGAIYLLVALGLVGRVLEPATAPEPAV
ncbi:MULTISPECIES: cytochrome c oxidase assembly protein [unclassified Phenylobacterium]|uniref:cytochrome c oxidase assembly protein n=1 Tax=unclassified Phenylobacterium TaxID=2640670 RepID=UPI00083A49E8|nr:MULTISPECIES: cytochrome c oxidase assembly protein [unclassified Phenylobacterium]